MAKLLLPFLHTLCCDADLTTKKRLKDAGAESGKLSVSTGPACLLRVALASGGELCLIAALPPAN